MFICTKNLIIFPGNGKTGSSSIKTYLNKNHDKLLDQGIFYLGMSFNNVKSIKYDKLSTLNHLLGGEIIKDPIKICEFSVDQINHAFNVHKNCHTFLWINESMIDQHHWFLNHFKRSLDLTSSYNVKYKIIYGIRDPSEYAISAFFQWGEGYEFRDFVLNRLMSLFGSSARGWLKVCDDFSVICKTRQNNIILDFIKNINFENDLPIPNITENITSSKPNYSKHKHELYLEQLNNDEELIKWRKTINKRYHDLLKYQLPSCTS